MQIMKNLLGCCLVLILLVPMNASAEATFAQQLLQTIQEKLIATSTEATATSTAATATSTSALQSIQTTFNEWKKEWDQTALAKELKEWQEQWKQLEQQIDEIKTVYNKIDRARSALTSQLTGMTKGVSNAFSLLDGLTATAKSGDSGYEYSQNVPAGYLGAKNIECSNDPKEACEYSGTGYVGNFSGVSSVEIRDNLRVTYDQLDEGSLLGLIGSKDLAQLSREAAEENAQEIAIIDAMAREAYAQASGRISRIMALRNAIHDAPKSEGTAGAEDGAKPEEGAKEGGATPTTKTAKAEGGAGTSGTETAGTSNSAVFDALMGGEYNNPSERAAAEHKDASSAAADEKENTLKRTADIQAMIAAEQSLLLNDQNKIAALAVLQQSQRDRYEQRKKELADAAAHGVQTQPVIPGMPSTDLSAGSLVRAGKRLAITGLTAGAFETLKAQYEW